ncbi:hypothetical protein P8452_19654 [Trifolium repens]|nr:hypothetical protein P8452_19654 [Trifolium repens]
MSWIKWDVVCLPKKKGGLGVRDVRVVNISLLAKWRWRLLSDDNTIWKEVIKAKYGEGVIGKTLLEDEFRPRNSSLWWKDVCSIGRNLDHNWFSENVIIKLGNGVRTRFWTDRWTGDMSLQARFPRLFSISLLKNASVADIVHQIYDMDRWSLLWRRRLFEWEKDLLQNMLAVINSTGPLSDAVDCWGWRLEGGGDFTVKSTYKNVSLLCSPVTAVSPLKAAIFSAIWSCPIPSKVSGFIWQLLHGKVPTRNNLLTRKIIDADGDASCALCGEEKETELHLFLYCEIAHLIWLKIFNWLDISFVLPHDLFSLLHCLMGDGNSKMRKGLLLIGCAVIWSIWRCRNSILFDNGRGSVAELVDAVKVSSWKWWLSRPSGNKCMFYEWCTAPRFCML